MSKEIEIKNPATMSNEKLKAYAKVIGVDFTEDVSHNNLKKAVGLKNREIKEAQGDSNTETQETPKKSNVFFYWLKDDTYIDDNRESSEKLLPAGLYKLDRHLPRLDGQPKTAVEIWEGEIPTRAIEKIAKSRGLVFDASDDVDFEEVLEGIVNDTVYKNLRFK